MRLVVEIRGVDAMVKRHAGFRQDLEAELYTELRAQAIETRNEMRAGAPSFTGALREGVRFRTSRKKLTATVRATAPHSWLVQHGRRPGKMPSIDPAHAANPKSANTPRPAIKRRGVALPNLCKSARIPCAQPRVCLASRNFRGQLKGRQKSMPSGAADTRSIMDRSGSDVGSIDA